MTEPTLNLAPALRVLSKQDIATLEIDLPDVIATVEAAFRALAAGQSTNPQKLTVKPADAHSVAYAMLGRDGAREVVAVKTSYKYDPAHDREQQRYYTTLSLYDDRTGLPIALMDCSRVGALRTPAVSALLARECARPDAKTALLIGTGTQGRMALPFLLHTLPQLERLCLFGTHPAGIAAVRDALAKHHPGRRLEIVDDLRAAAGEADVILGTAGPATPAAVEADWLKPGATAILVGYGLAPSTLHQADRVVTTSAAQMRVTGMDLADAAGKLPPVDAELPDILAGRLPGRVSPQDQVFVFNSGMVITDIALGHRFAQLAADAGLGTQVTLW